MEGRTASGHLSPHTVYSRVLVLSLLPSIGPGQHPLQLRQLVREECHQVTCSAQPLGPKLQFYCGVSLLTKENKCASFKKTKYKSYLSV